jgi:cytochrome P450
VLISRPPFDTATFDDADLLDSGFYTHADLHAIWTRLRDEQPAYRCDPGDGREPFWVLTRHADVSRVLRDHETFSSRRGTMLCIVDLSMPDLASDDMMPDTDPPRHRVLREPLNHALTPRVVARHEPAIRKIVRDLLDEALAADVFDIAKAALMFPMAFTGLLMGLPSEHWQRMSELTTMTIAYDDPDYFNGSSTGTVRQAHHELFAFFRDEAARRPHDDPAEDLIGILRRMAMDDAPLTEHQITLNCYALLLGANVTTPHVLTTMVMMMAEHPEQFRAVRENPDLIKPCVQELLRWSSPASHFMRYAIRDVELHGQTIRAGEPVSVWLGSANRDERVFTDPWTFDVTRESNRHVAFGVGPHYCIGSGLAMLGLTVFLEEMLVRVSRVELAGEVRHLASNFVAGYKSVPVRMTAVSAPRSAAALSG